MEKGTSGNGSSAHGTDHYDAADLAALGLSVGVSEQEVRATYRRLAIEHHPDRGGSHATMSSINEAFDRLMNPRPKPIPVVQPRPAAPSYLVAESPPPPETRMARTLFPALRTAGIPLLIGLLVILPAATIYGFIYVVGKILF